MARAVAHQGEPIPQRTVAFRTLGCKPNAVDTCELQRQFLARGYRIVPFASAAETYVVNTCSVTARSDRHCRRALRQAKRRNPDARVIAVGCYAETQPAALCAMPETDVVLGNSEKADIFAHLREEPPAEGASAAPTAAPRSELASKRFGDRDRAFVKVQDGCDQRCTYCVVPLARGRSRSLALEAVMAQVQALLRGGHLEIVLAGINLGAWGRDLHPPHDLAGLVHQLCAVAELEQLRLSSIEPAEFSPKLIDTLCHPKLCRHLHLPLQSGSASVLESMGRSADPSGYRELVATLQRTLPDLGLGADLIVGFPGETPADFEATCRLVEELPLSYLHVFPYSPRPGTAASSYSAQIAPAERDRRARVLRALGQRKARDFQRARIGRCYRALVSSAASRPGRRYLALTRNYLKVTVCASPRQANTYQNVRLTGHEGDNLVGEIVS